MPAGEGTDVLFNGCYDLFDKFVFGLLTFSFILTMTAELLPPRG